MLSSNEALKYVNYPTQALGKSVKIIPVMLMGAIFYRKRYAWDEWARMIIITIGKLVFVYDSL